MLFGATGGIIQPYVMKKINHFLEGRVVTEQAVPDVSPIADSEDETSCESQVVESDISFVRDYSLRIASDDLRSICANIQASICFILGSFLLAVPVYLHNESSYSMILLAFFGYEFLIGVYLPCEGTLRSIYFPDEEGCTLMTLLRVIVNILVAFGVLMTNIIQ